MKRKLSNDIPPHLQELLNAYDMLCNCIGRYPKSASMNSSVMHTKPKSNPLIDLRLYDKRSYIDIKIENMIEEIYQAMRIK
jgi:hypothetical protein